MKLIVASLSLFLLVFSHPAWTHHGWGHYDTAAPLVFAAHVVEVRWSNPHPELVVRVEGAAPPVTMLPMPAELEGLGFETVAAQAQPAPTGEWELHLAPINRLQAWGLPRMPQVGDNLEGIGFPSCTEDRAMRPVLIVLDGVGVRQQSVPLPTGCSGRPRG